MPKSRSRTKPVYTPPPKRAASKVPSPRWLVPVMLACLLIGLAWIALYYVTGGQLPVHAMGAWNLAVGFVLIIGGVGLSTKWR